MTPHLIEESHEVIEAIEDEDDDALATELGDLLLNLAFQIVLAEERGSFGAAEVVDRLEDKMRRRHPHLYGLGEEEEWEVLKAREREAEIEEGSVLQGLPRGLDPLSGAHRIQERVSGVGFDWEDTKGAFEKVEEEVEEVRVALEEWRSAMRGGEEETSPESRAEPALREAALEEELGDLLFAVVNLARLAGRHALTALRGANRKFTTRFEALEAMAEERGVILGEASLEELDALWEAVKGGET